MAEVIHNTFRGPPPTAPFDAPRPNIVPAGAGAAAWGASRAAAQGQAPGGMMPGGADAAPGLRHQQLAHYGAAPYDPTAVSKPAPTDFKSGAAYQKATAIRMAQDALRGWDPIAGIGERRGAPNVPGPGAGLGRGAAQFASPTAPSLHAVEDGKLAAAQAVRAGQVMRPGATQVGHADAWAPVQGAVERVLWPADMAFPDRYCTACRGVHNPANECNPSYEPYTPRMRLRNLGVLGTQFATALKEGGVCVRLQPDSAWQAITFMWQDAEGNTLTPGRMPQEQFTAQLALLIDGVRQGHEPHRFLAQTAAGEFIATRSPMLAVAAPALVPAFKLALNTLNPLLVGNTLLILQRLLKSHPGVGPALVPRYHHLLPVMALFKTSSKWMHLPPADCLGATGSFTGSGVAPSAGHRQCKVCGAPLDKEHDSKQALAQALADRAANAHKHAAPLPTVQKPRSSKGRPTKKHLLSEIIADTLTVMVEVGGDAGMASVRRVVPTFSYFNPKN